MIDESPSYVVGIGASAGGLEALERVFKPMPLDTGMAFVVIQHLSPDFKSLMDEILGRFTRLAVVRVVEPTELRANTVYLLSPNKEMVVEGTRLLLVERLADRNVHLPISRFFRSLAREWGERAIGVVLSVTGADGSAGLADVHDAGGLALAQSPATAKFDGMPRAALATGAVDHEVAPEELGALLLRFASNPDASPVVEVATLADEPEHPLARLFARLRDAYSVDFTLYKPATITRRIQRRMELGRHESFNHYCAHAADDPSELDSLYRDLLIGVTRFFRDPEVFEALRERYVPEIVDSVPADRDVRVWVPGCATGEEAYSLAMLFLDELERRGRGPALRVFATDVHTDSLRTAGRGLYPDESLETLPESLRQKYFKAQDDGFARVTSRVRKVVIFSEHNLLKDVPFNQLDMVSCRNLLIYFLPEAQTRALVSFHFALRAGGVMLLGPSESAGQLENDFETLLRPWKLYRKLAGVRLPLDLKLQASPAMPPTERLPALGDSRLARVHDQLLQRYMPPGVLVNERREVMHVFGDVYRYLHPAPGRASLDVVTMCDGDLRVAISAAIAGALRRRERAEVRTVHAHGGQHAPLVDVIAEPVDDKVSSSTFVLVQISEVRIARAPGAQEFVVSEDMDARLTQMEGDLRSTRESLQTTIEELEATNEELQASNEELLASNEELQSTNEELQSVNEELHSVNSEYNQKIEELAATSADLRNLVTTSHAGVVFMDPEQRIRLFTPGASQVLNLLPQDVGRPLSHITSRIPDDDVLAELGRVALTHASVERIVHLPDGRHFLRRLLPYEDSDHQPAGYVMTFLDVTERERVERVERRQTALLKAVIDASSSQIAVLDRKGTIVETNRAWDLYGEENGGSSGRALLGRNYLDGAKIDGPRTAELYAMVRDVFEGRRTTSDADYLCAGPAGDRWFWMSVAALPFDGGGALVSHTDITARKKADALELELAETAKLESLGVLAGGIAHDFNNILTGILGNANVLSSDYPMDADAREALGDIENSALRASDLCNKLLAYSGRKRVVRRKANLSEVVRETVNLVRASISKSARLELDLGESLPPVDVDLAQVQQVVMNLAINASEAVPPSGGVVKLSTSVGKPSPRPDDLEVVSPLSRHADHVLLEVTDTGSGIDPQLLRRIFEPFYTTKFAGRGLGLSAVQGIVRGHSGALFVASELSKGMRFRMFLPVAEGVVDVVRVAAPPPALTKPGARVLVVDDEPTVRRVFERILGGRGYACAFAEDGIEAEAMVATAPAPFDLIVLDLTMPRRSGIETLIAIRKLRPEQKIILVSGYAEAEVTQQLQGHPAIYLQKPVSSTDLLAAAHALLTK